MTERNIIRLFDVKPSTAKPSPTDRDLFGCVNEFRGKAVFLDEADWHEESLLQLMARNPIGAVVDMRARPVFRSPRYRHRQVVTYFHKHGIRYLELSKFLSELPPHRKSGLPDLAKFVFSGADMGLTICFYDASTKDRGWLAAIRAIMKSKASQFVELHPNALAGSDFVITRRR